MTPQSQNAFCLKLYDDRQFDCMDDFKANADDMDDEEAATNFGKKFLEAPWTMFKGLVFLIFGAMAVTQLMEIW